MKRTFPMEFYANVRRIFSDLQTSVRLSASFHPQRLARHWRRSFGRQGLWAVCLLALCAMVYVAIVEPMRERMKEARNNVVLLQRRNAGASTDVRHAAATPADQLTQFYQKFPAERNLPDAFEKLVTLAEAQGIDINEGEYRVTRDKVGKLIRFHMLFPLKAEYPRIRTFLTALPAVLPVIAVENVQFERQKVGDPTVEVKVRLVLYVEKT